MIEKTIEVEAESLEEAREQIKAKMPAGFCLFSTRVVSDGKPKTVRGVADTSEAAWAKAQAEVPQGAVVLEKKQVAAPQQAVISVEAYDQASAEKLAKAAARQQFTSSAQVKGVRPMTEGRKGVLGIGKKASQYQADIFQPAVVEITYQTNVRLSLQVRDDDPKNGAVGWIVYEKFPSSEYSDKRREVEKVAQSPEVRQDVIASGWDGWAVYAHQETAEKMARLLTEAGASDPGVRKVRCFRDLFDPRISNPAAAQQMESGWVIEPI